MQQHYQLTDPTVFMNQLPWVPQTVIIDAMFMITTKPLRRTITIADYGKLVFYQHALEHYRNGTSEVHLIFDSPLVQTFDPKQYERARRYSKNALPLNKMNTNHFTLTHTFHKDSKISLNVESVTRTMVEAIGFFFLQKAHLLLIKEQQY